MHTGLKNFLLLIVGAVFGAIFGVVGFIIFLHSGTGQNFISSYFVAQPSWPDIATLVNQSDGTLTPVQQQSVAQALTIPLGVKVPSKDASASYAGALNSVFADFQEIASSSEALGPLLVQMNSRSLTGNFNGFFDLVVQAKTLVAQQKILSSQLAQDLSALTVINQTTTDAVTKSLTQNFLSASTNTPADFNAYVASLDQLLSGSVPTAAQISNLASTGTTFNNDLATMGKAFGQLLTYFGVAATSTAAY